MFSQLTVSASAGGGEWISRSPVPSKGTVAEVLAGVRYVTLGSQIGNAFVVGNLTNGRIEPLPLKSWHHLYNKEDDVFTAPIKLWTMPSFRQVETPFDIA